MSQRQRQARRERGQMVVMMAVIILGILAFTGLILDGGNYFAERRQAQNAADEAALAGAYEIKYGGDIAAARVAALANASANGYNNDGTTNTVTVNIGPKKGKFLDNPKFVEVLITKNVPTFLVHLVAQEGSVGARGVAGVFGTGGSAEDDDGGVDAVAQQSVPVPTGGCSGAPVVDGRVLGSEGYGKIADLVGGGTTDYGDAFYACDATYYYFALRLNGPSTGGAVANENVYWKNKDYNTLYETGWAKSHGFGKLLGSDRARFSVSCGATAVHDFVQDYLRGDSQAQGGWTSDAVGGDGKPIALTPAMSASSLEWNLEHPNETGWGDDPGEDPQQQSPPFNPKYPTYDAQYSGWVWEVIYEFAVPRSAYSSCTSTKYFRLVPFNGQSGPVGGIHNSPAKVKTGGSVFLSPIDIRLVE